MSQKGILAFFSKTPKKTSQNQPTTTPTKRKAESTNGDSTEAPGSPIFKSKTKKRRIIDSDDSDTETGGVDKTVTNNTSEKVEHVKAVGNGVRRTESPSKVEAMTTEHSTTKSTLNGTQSELLKTPPRRMTARKHTAKMQSPVISQSSPPSQTSSTPTSTSVERDTATTEKGEQEMETEEAEVSREEKEKELEVNLEATGQEAGHDGDECMEEEAVSSSPKEDASTKDVDGAVDSTTTSDNSEVSRKTEDGGSAAKKPVHSSFFAQRKSPSKAGKRTKTVKSSKDNGSQSEPTVTSGECVSESDYNPSLTNYHPLNHACWTRGQKVPYMAVSRTFERIEEESKRLKIISTLTNFLRSVVLLSPEEMVQCVYLCLNKLAPAYDGLELGIGESFLIKAIAGATGRTPHSVKSDYQEKGDLGLVAEASRGTQRTMFAPPKLTVASVFTKFKTIASMSGSASQAKKVDIIRGLLVACKHSEARYLIRSLGGKLRIGLAEQSVLMAIAHSVVYTPPCKEWPPVVLDASKTCSSEVFHKQLEDAVLRVKSSYCELPNYDVLIPALLTHGIDQLSEHCKLTPGIPLKPMLAHPTKGVQEVLRRFEGAKFTCEWKYDGERAQIHVMEGGETRVYSRNSENNTSKYPDIIKRMPKVLKDSVSSCVLDAEAVAWDTEKKQILPFQILSTRKRKDAELSEIKVQVCVFAFDLIYLNGKSLVKEPFQTRRELLQESFNEIEGEFMFAQAKDSSDLNEIQVFMEESIQGNCEGLMVKTLDKEATYEIAKRSHNWLKLKKDYLEGVGDTLDLVVVGGFHGSGKRAGKYGGFLLACYDGENEEYQVICKIGTGFKDDDLDRHSTFFKEHVIESPKPYYRFSSQGVQPDHWFDAVQVWEVKAADLSISPVYTAAAGIVDPEKGISLRFPRFLRIRDDKGPESATTSSQVADMYRSQVNNAKPAAEKQEEDFY